MRTSRFALIIACAAMVVSCGGGNSAGAPTGSAPSPTPSTSPTPTPTTAQCSLSQRESFVLNALNQWYLFPSLLDTTVDPKNYATVQDYINALVAPARAQNKDRYFTYITSISQENAYYNQGASAGFGIRLGYDTGANRVFVIEAFEGAPALAANIDRGTEILAIGTTSSDLATVNSLMMQGGPQAVIDALGPGTAGVQRTLQIIDQSGIQRTVTLNKATYDLQPVSSRYGEKIIDDNGTKVGYVNLRTFIDTANSELSTAIGDFRAQGITRIIVDLRYNGGGLISVADHFGDLLNKDNTGKVFEKLTFRPSQSSNDSTHLLAPTADSIQPTRIAFIGTHGTASASEIMINGMVPYMNGNLALVGSNTYGKPVGQVALDNTNCDDRLRAIAFAVENAAGTSDYFNGLATVVPNTCQANDDISHQLGDPNEAMIATALTYLDGRSCTPIANAAVTTQSVGRSGLLVPANPTTAQRESPGVY